MEFTSQEYKRSLGKVITQQTDTIMFIQKCQNIIYTLNARFLEQAVSEPAN